MEKQQVRILAVEQLKDLAMAYQFMKGLEAITDPLTEEQIDLYNRLTGIIAYAEDLIPDASLEKIVARHKVDLQEQKGIMQKSLVKIDGELTKMNKA